MIVIMFLINCYVSMVLKLLKFLEVNLYVVEEVFDVWVNF